MRLKHARGISTARTNDERRTMKRIPAITLLAFALLLCGCGGPSGRCHLGSPGYPLCGI